MEDWTADDWIAISHGRRSDSEGNERGVGYSLCLILPISIHTYSTVDTYLDTLIDVTCTFVNRSILTASSSSNRTEMHV